MLRIGVYRVDFTPLVWHHAKLHYKRALDTMLLIICLAVNSALLWVALSLLSAAGSGPPVPSALMI